MDRNRVPNGVSAIPRGPRSPTGRYICERTVPTLQAGLTKMFGFVNVVFGIFLVLNGIAVIVIQAGNYQIGAAVWGGIFATCAGLVALMTGTKRKKVVITCVTLCSLAIVAVFAAGIVSGTGIQLDDAIIATQGKTSEKMKARIVLNVVSIVLCIIILFASIFVVFLCGKALDDAAYAKDVDVSKLYPSRLSREPMDGINNPCYIEEQVRGVANGPVRLLDTKQPILLLPLKEKQMDTISISYDLTDGHSQLCRIVRYNSSEQSETVTWDRSVSREDLAFTELSPENQAQDNSGNESTLHREVSVEFETQAMADIVHRQNPSADAGYIVLDTIDAKKRSENYTRYGDGDEFDHPALSHWNTLASLEMDSESSVGFSDVVKMTPDESVSSPLQRRHSFASSSVSAEPTEEELREFAKQFVRDICEAAVNEMKSELQLQAEVNESIPYTLQTPSHSCNSTVDIITSIHGDGSSKSVGQGTPTVVTDSDGYNDIPGGASADNVAHAGEGSRSAGQVALTVVTASGGFSDVPGNRKVSADNFGHGVESSRSVGQVAHSIVTVSDQYNDVAGSTRSNVGHGDESSRSVGQGTLTVFTESDGYSDIQGNRTASADNVGHGDGSSRSEEQGTLTVLTESDGYSDIQGNRRASADNIGHSDGYHKSTRERRSSAGVTVGDSNGQTWGNRRESADITYPRSAGKGSGKGRGQERYTNTVIIDSSDVVNFEKKDYRTSDGDFWKVEETDQFEHDVIDRHNSKNLTVTDQHNSKNMTDV